MYGITDFLANTKRQLKDKSAIDKISTIMGFGYSIMFEGSTFTVRKEPYISSYCLEGIRGWDNTETFFKGDKLTNRRITNDKDENVKLYFLSEFDDIIDKIILEETQKKEYDKEIEKDNLAINIDKMKTELQMLESKLENMKN